MISQQPRLAVFAYSDVGHASLQVLLARGANVVAVFTHEDNPSENHWFSSVADLATAHSIPVYKPDKLRRADWEQTLRETLRPDIIFSFYYRNMIPTWVLAIPALGAYNMHGSYLPKYRGRAPVNWAVLHGETMTGATLHIMVREPDAGDIVDQEPVSIGPDDTAGEVMGRVKEAAVAVLQRQLDALLAGKAPRTPQLEAEATYYGGRKPEDGRIDWTRSARDIHNLVRAVTRPYPGAFCDQLKPGQRTLIWRTRPVPAPGTSHPPGTILSGRPLVVSCGQDALEILEHETRAPEAG